MAANYWLKVWTEMLDDRKVASLPDSSYRRWMECLMLAKEYDRDGLLPSLDDMAWRLRISAETLQSDMSRLAMNGLVELVPTDAGDRWFITMFTDRQRASTPAERKQLERERANDTRYSHDDVTIRDNPVTQSREEKSREEKEREENARATNPTPISPQIPNEFKPIPESLKRAKARRGEVDQPPTVPAAPPSLAILYQLTSYWPGDDNAGYLHGRLGDEPDENALARAVDLWRAAGYKVNNWIGICDWYDELRHDPNWQPGARSKTATGKQPAKPQTTEGYVY